MEEWSASSRITVPDVSLQLIGNYAVIFARAILE